MAPWMLKPVQRHGTNELAEVYADVSKATTHTWGRTHRQYTHTHTHIRDVDTYRHTYIQTYVTDRETHM